MTSSNSAAVTLIDDWPAWPARVALLVGPPGSGKSHLAEVWRQRSHSSRIAASDLHVEAVPSLLSTSAMIIEDAGAGLDERALFHALNLAAQQAGSILVTSQTKSEDWAIALPDLVSRLRAMPTVSILPPDDELLRGVIVKLFWDRQIAAEEAVINLMVTRMPRSLDAARELVAEIDRRAMEGKAEVTRPFVARILATLYPPKHLDEPE